MARITEFDSNSSAATHSPNLQDQAPVTTAQNIVISPAGLSEVPIPGHGFVSNAIMSQEGSDLVLETPDGITLVIEGYFSSDTPPNLVSPDGKVLSPALVKSFIQASSEFAEEQTVSMNDASPIGEVSEVTGKASVTHSDGSKEAIVKGTQIYEGDIIETDAQGAVNISFADESSFAVSNNAKLAIDKYVYNSQDQGGENDFSVLRGLFVYTSGVVGREDPDDVHINTPIGSIGIRGTIISGVIPADGSGDTGQITVIEGAIVINSVTGQEITLSQQFETVQIDTSSGTMTNVGVLPETQMSETFNVLRAVAPTFFSAVEDAAQEAPSDQVAPVDQTSPPGEILPADDQSTAPSGQPSEEPAPQEQPLPQDTLQLNLMEDNIIKDPINDGIVADQSLTGNNDSPLVSDGSVAVLPPPPVGALPPPPAGVLPPPPVGVLPPPPVPVVNLAPIANVSSHAALDQAGLEGQTHSYNLKNFFRDPNNDALSFNIVGGPLPAQLSGANIDAAGNLIFTVASLAGDPTVNLQVTASDGSLTSTPITFTFQLYNESNSTGTFGLGDDTGVTVSSSFQRFSTLAGDDDILIIAPDNRIFLGLGNDSAIASGNDNKIFGEGGNDSLSINNVTGSLLSGGNGNDELAVSLVNAGNTFQIFGGNENDTIIFQNATAITSLQVGNGFVDGGAGFDTLRINAGASIDLSLVAQNKLMSIEKLLINTVASTTVNLDIADILQHTSNKTLYLDVDNNDFINVTNNYGGLNLTQRTGTVADPTGSPSTYNIYSNGNVTLYISTDANPANVTI